MSTLKISVITISYNSRLTIERTILSVLHQNYDNLEYIIIDGGSTDGTLDIVNKYKEKINYVISEPDNGISDAFNKGIRIATGNVIGLINSDDIYAENAIRNIADGYRNDIDVYYGDIVMVSNNGYKYRCVAENNLERLKKHFIMFHPATFISSAAYKKYGLYDTNYKYAMDFELLSRMYISGAKFVHINEPLAWFSKSGASNNNADKTTKESINIAIRNGTPKKEASLDYNLTNFVQKTLSKIKAKKIEGFIRKNIKKQPQYAGSEHWFDNDLNSDFISFKGQIN